MQKNQAMLISAQEQTLSLKRVLNAGSGPLNARKLHPVFAREAWQEIRIDVDPQAKPDIVSSITDIRSCIRIAEH